MISGYSQNGRPSEALEIFHEMQRAGIEADVVTATTVISALSQLGRSDLAHWITDYIELEGIEQNELLQCFDYRTCFTWSWLQPDQITFVGVLKALEYFESL
ncbi:hypothetical protein Droror1_Dr00021985 [Drosera rotundifolia]